MKATATAYERCKYYPALEIHRFMDAFKRGRSAEMLGYDTYEVFRGAWNAGDSVFLAGFLEGIASTRESTGTEYGVKRS